MAGTDYISQRRLEYFWEQAKEYIARAVQPSGDKEVIGVLTASGNAPANPSEGDYWLDTTNVRLKQWSVDVWVSHDPEEDVIYITSDTSHMYVYKDGDFVDVTGEIVDNTIYVNSINDIDVVQSGLYTVCVSGVGFGAGSTYYTLLVSVTDDPRRGTTYTQMLHNFDGYLSRTKRGAGSWSDWDVFEYASKAMLPESISGAEIDNLFE